MAAGSITVVMAALACGGAIAATTLAAALHTGSSALLSAAVQALIGASSQALMLCGLKRAGRPADAAHPFGYARELHFWGFVVAILLFAMGSGVAIHEGVDRLIDPRPLVRPEVAYIAVAVAVALHAIATAVALAGTDRQRADRPRLAALRAASDPTSFIVLLESVAALAGSLLVLAAVAAAHPGGWPQGDGLAAIAIGLLLGLVAAVFAIEIKGRLTGEAAHAVVTATGARAGPRETDSEAQPGPAATPAAAPPPQAKQAEAAGADAARAGATQTGSGQTGAGPADEPEQKPQIVARPSHARKGRGKRRR